MVKKTILKRASKTWPQCDRLDQAIHHLNTDGGEGIELASNATTAAPPDIQFNAQNALQLVSQSATLQGLQDEWKTAAAGCRKTEDKVAYGRIKAAVLERSEYLKSMAITEVAEAA